MSYVPLLKRSIALEQAMNASAPANVRPAVYIVAECDGTFTAFVRGRGFAANQSLPAATRFIREQANRDSGSVPCFDAATGQWTSEIDLSPKA